MNILSIQHDAGATSKRGSVALTPQLLLCCRSSMLEKAACMQNWSRIGASMDWRTHRCTHTELHCSKPLPYGQCLTIQH